MHYIVHYKNGCTLVINKDVYDRGRIYNGMPLSFLTFVESLGEWLTIDKVD